MTGQSECIPSFNIFDVKLIDKTIEFNDKSSVVVFLDRVIVTKIIEIVIPSKSFSV